MVGSRVDVGAVVNGDLGEDGVSVRADSRSRMTLSLTVICKVLVVISRVSVAMVDRF